MLLASAYLANRTEVFSPFVHSVSVPRPLAVTEYSFNEQQQASIAFRQFEDCGVPCECPRCASAYHRLMSIQRQMQERRLGVPSRNYVQYE